MYLSKLRIEPVLSAPRLRPPSPTRLRAAVLAATSSSGSRRALWRLDRVGLGATLTLVTSGEPALDQLRERAGASRWRIDGATRPYDLALGGLRVGQRWRFRLTASPSLCATPGTTPSRPGPRCIDRRRPPAVPSGLGHVHEPPAGWFANRAATWGVVLPGGLRSILVSDVSSQRAVRYGVDGRVAARTVVSASFEGVLEVADPDRLRHCLVSGVGPARDLGCGLLTLAQETSG